MNTEIPELTPVSSSQIEAVGYRDDTMFIQFKRGATYSYDNVSQELYEKVRDAPSVGREFADSIKSNPAKFPYKKLK